MTISNETKIGALTAIAIVFLILGFNFLNGKNIAGKNTRYYAVFNNIEGLAISNPVVINGKQVGNIDNTDGGKDMRRIVVDINITEDVIIPSDAIAVINKSLIGNVQLEIRLGNSTTPLKVNDTLRTIPSSDLIGDAMKKLDPVLYQVTNVGKSLDTLLGSFNTIFDPKSKQNIKGMLENLNRTTASLAVSSASLQGLLNNQTGALAQTLDNVNSFTGALKNSEGSLTQTLGNMATTTDKLAKLDFEKTLTTLNATVTDLKNAIAKMSSSDGSLGLLLNDPSLYRNLNATSNKINLLLDDIRVNPKRYVNVSVFGKKDKKQPLMVPLPDTVNAPYLKTP